MERSGLTLVRSPARKALKVRSARKVLQAVLKVRSAQLVQPGQLDQAARKELLDKWARKARKAFREFKDSLARLVP